MRIKEARQLVAKTLGPNASVVRENLSGSFYFNVYLLTGGKREMIGSARRPFAAYVDACETMHVEVRSSFAESQSPTQVEAQPTTDTNRRPVRSVDPVQCSLCEHFLDPVEMAVCRCGQMFCEGCTSLAHNCKCATSRTEKDLQRRITDVSIQLIGLRNELSLFGTLKPEQKAWMDLLGTVQETWRDEWCAWDEKREATQAARAA